MRRCVLEWINIKWIMLNSAGADPQLRVRRPFACGFVLKLVLRIPWRSSHVDKEMDVKEMDIKEMDVDKANAMSPCEHLLEVPHECMSAAPQ